MRYPPTHKLDTRRRIVAAASAAFRERGVENTGVDEVMRRAGLTHGDFTRILRTKPRSWPRRAPTRLRRRWAIWSGSRAGRPPANGRGCSSTVIFQPDTGTIGGPVVWSSRWARIWRGSTVRAGRDTRGDLRGIWIDCARPCGWRGMRRKPGPRDPSDEFAGGGVAVCAGGGYAGAE